MLHLEFLQDYGTHLSVNFVFKEPVRLGGFAYDLYGIAYDL